MSPLAQFLIERAHRSPGHRILLTQFLDEFRDWCSPEERYAYSRPKIVAELRQHFPVGAHSGNVRWVANISFEPVRPNKFEWIEFDRKLKKLQTKNLERRARLAKVLAIIDKQRTRDPGEIAAQLNQRGYRDLRGNRFSAVHIQLLLESLV